jgi:hypothetical protein
MRTMISGAIIVLAGAVVWGAGTIAKTDNQAFTTVLIVYSIIGWFMVVAGAITDRRPPSA